MSSIVYLSRSPLEVVSPFLYSKTKVGTVIAIEKAPLAGKVLESSADCSLVKGTPLSFKQLLEVLLVSQRVITL